ncbi:ATP-dependent Clp protease adapter ClpS [Lysinibacter sp. HNR]|uniref:ATP-dependent Clp protease adapter ClpS n=1 Tax=Lysinibacter sp. HNR TaxID=3031408 RepID=UPI00243483F2|nr:ATP-dependent Clp protease adapter ClpS [Lysinibacter sp. HNR]WGD38448.1 ATP-dependent Clp protease adapter ClpS [Lysinibacter sp. HNR]
MTHAPEQRPAPETTHSTRLLEKPAPPWQTIVWDDPVNLMSYVRFVFQRHFGFSQDQAEELMLRVHNNGHAVVAEGTREAMEMHVEAMHDYGLWSTLRQAGA